MFILILIFSGLITFFGTVRFFRLAFLEGNSGDQKKLILELQKFKFRLIMKYLGSFKAVRHIHDSIVPIFPKNIFSSYFSEFQNFI